MSKLIAEKWIPDKWIALAACKFEIQYGTYQNEKITESVIKQAVAELLAQPPWQGPTKPSRVWLEMELEKMFSDEIKASRSVPKG